MDSLPERIDTFFDHYAKSFDRLETEFDPQWPSPCEVGTHWTDLHSAQARICWQPQRREPPVEDFAGLENALEMSIHPDIKTHYGRYWSANLEAEAPDGHVTLLYLWNTEDQTRLIENLIGHALACKQNRTPFSVFFATTDPESDYFLTVNNDTGRVQVEAPARKPLRTVSENLAEFYTTLTPAREQHTD
ncbi:MAG: SecY-interacting protein Syd [Pseudomonadota bacterium]